MTSFIRYKFNDVYFINIIFSERITFPGLFQEDPAQVGMVVEPDPKQVIYFPFVKFGGISRCRNRINGGIFTVGGSHFQHQLMIDVWWSQDGRPPQGPSPCQHLRGKRENRMQVRVIFQLAGPVRGTLPAGMTKVRNCLFSSNSASGTRLRIFSFNFSLSMLRTY